MTPFDLRKYDLVYLGTPYTNYRAGIEIAFADACKAAAKLVRCRVPVFSPIVHGHPIAFYGRIDPRDHDLWMQFDEAMMKKSDALVVAQLDGWDESRGVRMEMKAFERARKPIYFFEPDTEFARKVTAEERASIVEGIMS